MIGIIGGTAVGQALGALGGKSVTVETPFGAPSSPIVTANVGGVDVAILYRHGIGHTTPPSSVNYRANIWALKKVGVTRIISLTAVGSLREEIHPGELAIPDQMIDRTQGRAGTFFDDVAVHVEFADPYCDQLRSVLLESAASLKTKVHPTATVVVMEGPQFSTRAESHLHRSWGAHLIGMTAAPEAKLAREAELCYGAIALPTDYDCWRPHSGSREALLTELRHNMAQATNAAMSLLTASLPHAGKLLGKACSCLRSLDGAVFTDAAALTPAVKARHELLLKRRFGG